MSTKHPAGQSIQSTTQFKEPTMNILQSVKHAARFSVSPKFSLFHTSATGEYRLICVETIPERIVDRFREEAIRPETVGLELRCDGFRVNLD